MCNSTHAQIPTAIKGAQAGMHLFIEKPIGRNLEGSIALLLTPTAWPQSRVENARLRECGEQLGFLLPARLEIAASAEGDEGRVVAFACGGG